MKILYAVNNVAAKSPRIVFGKIELLTEHCRNIMSLLLHGTRVRQPQGLTCTFPWEKKATASGKTMAATEQTLQFCQFCPMWKTFLHLKQTPNLSFPSWARVYAGCTCKVFRLEPEGSVALLLPGFTGEIWLPCCSQVLRGRRSKWMNGHLV